MASFTKCRFLYLFGCSVKTSILWSYFINLTKASPSYLFNNYVIVKIIPVLHLDKTIPFDSYVFVVVLALLLLSFLLHDSVFLVIDLFRWLSKNNFFFCWNLCFSWVEIILKNHGIYFFKLNLSVGLYLSDSATIFFDWNSFNLLISHSSN